MDSIEVERIGGFAGFGLPGSRLRSHGRLDASHLAADDRKVLEALFARRGPPSAPAPDGFRYRITRRVGGHTETIEAAEPDVPATVRDCVQDELN
ncbi:MAG: protealysin inhibitor emfourin [Ramlibacter sp.]